MFNTYSDKEIDKYLKRKKNQNIKNYIKKHSIHHFFFASKYTANWLNKAKNIAFVEVSIVHLCLISFFTRLCSKTSQA